MEGGSAHVIVVALIGVLLLALVGATAEAEDRGQPYRLARPMEVPAPTPEFTAPGFAPPPPPPLPQPPMTPAGTTATSLPPPRVHHDPRVWTTPQSRLRNPAQPGTLSVERALRTIPGPVVHRCYPVTCPPPGCPSAPPPAYLRLATAGVPARPPTVTAPWHVGLGAVPGRPTVYAVPTAMPCPGPCPPRGSPQPFGDLSFSAYPGLGGSLGFGQHVGFPYFGKIAWEIHANYQDLTDGFNNIDSGNGAKWSGAGVGVKISFLKFARVHPTLRLGLGWQNASAELANDYDVGSIPTNAGQTNYFGGYGGVGLEFDLCGNWFTMGPELRGFGGFPDRGDDWARTATLLWHFIVNF